MKCVLLLVCVALLVGCATVPTAVSTPSGRPEVFIPGATPEQVKPVIINRGLSKGWQLIQDTSYQVSFTHPVKNFAAIALYGSQFNGTPSARTHFTITAVEGGTQIFYNGEMVTNPGSAFEKTYPFEDCDKNVFPEMQKALEEIKATVLAGNPTRASH